MNNSLQLEQPSSAPGRGDVGSSAETFRPTIRILALFETTTVSGPAKNVFQFCRMVRELTSGPIVDMALATFQRPSERGKRNEFAEAAQQWHLPLHFIPETYPFDVRVLSHLR